MAPLDEMIRATKARLLKMHYDSSTGHIGGNLSCLDALMVLFHSVLQPEDEFVLSKGHAAGALYATLWSIGALSDDDLRTFHGDSTRLSGHPAPGCLPHVAFATGSLGHGLSLASGMALGRRLQGRDGRIFCLMSDGEWQEGSCWEALIFAARHALPVTAIVDTNGLQGFGSTDVVAAQGPLTERFRSFGVPVVEIDGHSVAELTATLSQRPDGLEAIVARTNKGNGVSFMQGRMEWHYLPLTEAQFVQALGEIDAP